MRLRYTWIVIILMWLPAVVCAETYQFTDENGVERLTDNLAQVPEGIPADDLLKTKAELDQEHSELVKEAEALNSMAGTPLSKEDFEALKEKVNQFNERRADYENRVNEFQRQVDDFHQQQAMEAEAFTKTENQKAATAESLNKTRAELDKEHTDLMEERKAIYSECLDRKEFATSEESEACKQKVADFNERQADYERRAKAYREESEAFNQSLK